MTPDDKTNWWTFTWRLLKKDSESRESFYFVLFFFGIIYFMKRYMKIDLESDESPISLKIFSKKVIAFLVFMVFLGLFSFLFNIRILDYVYDNTAFYWNKYIKWIYNSSAPSPFSSVDLPSVDNIDSELSSSIHHAIAPITGTEDGSSVSHSSSKKEEVFNMGDNEFTYMDAKAVCASIGSRLATYPELEEAYQNGAEWCKYGWTDGQMALFPTQKQTWKELQKNPKQKNNCGRPGINGGYIQNPNILYSANCFGTKPSNPNWKPNPSLYTSYTEDSSKPSDPKVDYWKTHQGDLSISPYHPEQWSSVSQ